MKLPYVLVARRDGQPYYVGPFDTYVDAARYGLGTEDIRWHVVTLTQDDAHAPLAVLAPTHAAAVQRHELAIKADRVRGGVA